MIWWFPPDKVKFGFVLWETRRIKLGKGRKWIQAPHAGAPQRPPSPATAKVTPEKDQGSTAREGRQGQQQHGKPKKFWRHSDFLNWRAWALGLGSLAERMGRRGQKENCPLGNKRRTGCLASVHSWILSLCEVHGLETPSAYWDRVCTSKAVVENIGFIRRHISKCPWQEYKCFLMWRGPIPFCYVRPRCGFQPPSNLGWLLGLRSFSFCSAGASVLARLNQVSTGTRESF